MAVYEKTFKAYDGPQTDMRWRFLVLTKFGFKDAFKSKAFLSFYLASLLPSLIGIVLIYVSNNLELLKTVGIGGMDLDAITMGFFSTVFGVQLPSAFLIVTIIGPALLSADLANNALPLYLGRPLTRVGYLAGKASILVGLLLPVTILPGLAMWGLQAYYGGGTWIAENMRIFYAFVLGHAVWITVVTLVSLAISVSVGHKALARGVLLGIFFVPTGIAQFINALFSTTIGNVIALPVLTGTVVSQLFSPDLPTPMPLSLAWVSLIVWCLGACWVLHKRLQAYEEVS